MDKFPNLKRLFSGGKDLPVRDDNYLGDYSSYDEGPLDIGKTFPQYGNYIQNANDQVLTDKANEYVYNKATDIIDRPVPFEPHKGDRSETSALDELVLKSKPDEGIKQYLTNLHNVSTYKNSSRPYKDLNVVGDALDYNRQDINRLIGDTYMKDVHPEWHQNRKISQDTDKYREQEELLKYNKQIAKEVLGELPQADLVYGRSLKRTNASGSYNPDENRISVADPAQTSTIVHELQHARDHKEFPDRRGGSEKLYDLKGESKPTDAMLYGNRGHINSYLDEQKDIPSEISEFSASRDPVGESAPWFNHIRKLLSN